MVETMKDYLPNLLADETLGTWSTGFLYLGTDVNIPKEVDWSTYHVGSERRFADGYMGVDGWLPTRLEKIIIYEDIVLLISSETFPLWCTDQLALSHSEQNSRKVSFRATNLFLLSLISWINKNVTHCEDQLTLCPFLQLVAHNLYTFVSIDIKNCYHDSVM